MVVGSEDDQIWNGKKHQKKEQGDNSHSSLVGLFPAWSVDDRPFFHTRLMASNQIAPGSMDTEGVVAKIPLFYASGGFPKSASGLALGFLVGTHQRRMAQTTWVFFFALHSSYDDTKADQCSKNNFLEESQQEQKQKHIVDFTFNDLYILKGESGKG